jgi:hypothetical protein
MAFKVTMDRSIMAFIKKNEDYLKNFKNSQNFNISKLSKKFKISKISKFS